MTRPNAGVAVVAAVGGAMPSRVPAKTRPTAMSARMPATSMVVRRFCATRPCRTPSVLRDVNVMIASAA
jgi:hypothetical protein